MLNAETRSDAPARRLDGEVYTVAEAARQFRPPVHPLTVYRKIYSGELRVLDGLGVIRIPRSELERYFSKVVTYTPRKRTRIKKVAEAAGAQ